MRRALGGVVTAFSLAGLLFVAVCLAFRWDALTAVTLVPAGAWLAPGWLSAIVMRWLGARKLALVVASLWLTIPLVFMDTPLALLQTTGNWPTSEPAPPGRLRVATLNCSASLRAAREAAAFAPDILLLQEAPGEAQLSELCRELYGDAGDFHRGPDCAVLARGKVTSVVPRGAAPAHSVHARVTLSAGREFQVVSLRLHPVPWRLDFWSGDFWRTYAEHRQAQRRELKAIIQAIHRGSGEAPVVIAGDMNAPASDAIFREMPATLRDAFVVAGAGWGNTILNDYPVHRIDQIWASESLRPVVARAVRTKHSDHRLVVAEFDLP